MLGWGEAIGFDRKVVQFETKVLWTPMPISKGAEIFGAVFGGVFLNSRAVPFSLFWAFEMKQAHSPRYHRNNRNKFFSQNIFSRRQIFTVAR